MYKGCPNALWHTTCTCTYIHDVKYTFVCTSHTCTSCTYIVKCMSFFTFSGSCTLIDIIRTHTVYEYRLTKKFLLWLHRQIIKYFPEKFNDRVVFMVSILVLRVLFGGGWGVNEMEWKVKEKAERIDSRIMQSTFTARYLFHLSPVNHLLPNYQGHQFQRMQHWLQVNVFVHVHVCATTCRMYTCTCTPVGTCVCMTCEICSASSVGKKQYYTSSTCSEKTTLTVMVDNFTYFVGSLTKTFPSHTLLKPSSKAWNGSRTDSSSTYRTYART